MDVFSQWMKLFELVDELYVATTAGLVEVRTCKGAGVIP